MNDLTELEEVRLEPESDPQDDSGWEEIVADISTNEEYDDAVIEDSTSCDLCKRHLLCGDNDCIVGEDGLCVCEQCALRISAAYIQHLKDGGD